MTSHLPGGKPGTRREGSDARQGTGLRFIGETVTSVSSASSGRGPPCLVSGPVRLTDVDGRDIAHPDQVGFWRGNHVTEGEPK